LELDVGAMGDCDPENMEDDGEEEGESGSDPLVGESNSETDSDSDVDGPQEETVSTSTSTVSIGGSKKRRPRVD